MTSHVARLYALAASLLALFLAWAGIAAQPWRQPPSGTVPPALAEYQQRLRDDAALVAKLVARKQATVAPAVRVVTLPPLTTTRTS